MKDVSLEVFAQTRDKLATLRPAKLTDIAVRLGYPQGATGMLSDVLHGRHKHVSDASLNDLRRRLGLPYQVTHVTTKKPGPPAWVRRAADWLAAREKEMHP